jgi:hypothetical protein
VIVILMKYREAVMIINIFKKKNVVKMNYANVVKIGANGAYVIVILKQ